MNPHRHVARLLNDAGSPGDAAFGAIYVCNRCHRFSPYRGACPDLALCPDGWMVERRLGFEHARRVNHWRANLRVIDAREAVIDQIQQAGANLRWSVCINADGSWVARGRRGRRSMPLLCIAESGGAYRVSLGWRRRRCPVERLPKDIDAFWCRDLTDAIHGAFAREWLTAYQAGLSPLRTTASETGSNQ